MEGSLRLVSLNVERSKHVDRVSRFLQDVDADVVCLQECMEQDIPLFEKASGGTCIFTPMTIEGGEGKVDKRGIAVLSRLQVQKQEQHVYAGNSGALVRFDSTTPESKHRTSSYVLLVCSVEKEGVQFDVATTHFTWTPAGEADDQQRKDIRSMLSVLSQYDELVLCGDFNAPRGGEIFSMLTARYKDNVPAHYTTSIDGELHRAGPLPFMVDGIFSTSGYRVWDVEMKSGVSDHCALVAKAARA